MSKTTTNPVPTRTVKAKALTDEMGRRRNNKSRVPGEKVRTKAYYLASFTAPEMKAMLEGEVITKTYKSGRTESYKVG